MTKKTRTVLIIAIPLVLISAFLIRKYVGTSDRVAVQSATAASTSAVRDSRLAARAIRVMPSPFSNRIFTTGSVIANEEVRLRPETSGRITAMLLDEGAVVRKGDVLITINDADLQAQLHRTMLQMELAELREQRQKSLLENRAIAQEDYDVALNQLNTIRAEADLIRAQIEKTKIRAPFDGRIGLRNVSLGAYISPNDVVATLQDYSRVKIDFSIPERHAGLVSTGDRITFRRQGSEGDYIGTVMAIEPRIDLETRTLRIRAVATNSDGLIIPGAFAEIQYELRAIPDALMVPSEAVIPELGGHSIFITRNGLARRISVQTGIRTETMVQIVEGLTPGDTVLTTGILQLREGMPVRISEIQETN
jgi:membrane fusion protein (multidrug efflux system)